MDDETKKKINERYERELNRGERFWPDSIFKDVIVSLAIFVILVLLAEVRDGREKLDRLLVQQITGWQIVHRIDDQIKSRNEL